LGFPTGDSVRGLGGDPVIERPFREPVVPADADVGQRPAAGQGEDAGTGDAEDGGDLLGREQLSHGGSSGIGPETV
jgi:hypothetical protein